MEWLNRWLGRGKPDFADIPVWQNYQAHFKNDYTKHTPLSEVRFVVLDTETTGLNPLTDHILSIGAVAVRNRQIFIEDRYEAYLPQSTQAVPSSSIPIHGILQKHSATQTATMEALLTGFVDYLQNAVIVGHHVSFDKGILAQHCRTYLGGSLINRTADTIYLAQRVESPWFNTPTAHKPAAFELGALCQQYHIPIQDRHTATGDTMLTALLFIKLMGRLEKKGVKTLGDLLRHA